MAVPRRKLVVGGGLWAAQNLTLVDLDEAQQIAERPHAAASGGQPPPTNVEFECGIPKRNSNAPAPTSSTAATRAANKNSRKQKKLPRPSKSERARSRASVLDCASRLALLECGRAPICALVDFTHAARKRRRTAAL